MHSANAELFKGISMFKASKQYIIKVAVDWRLPNSDI